MLFNKKFDLVISLGEDCSCATYLRKFGLRKKSFPYDWLCGASFNTRVNLLLDNFKDFLNKEDFKINEKAQNNTSGDKRNTSYVNLKNDFVFHHDFRADTPFDNMFPMVEEKYSRRISRMYNLIQTSQNVLFVFYNKSSKLDNSDYIEAQKKLALKFSNTDKMQSGTKTYIYMLILENDDNADDVIKKECLGENVLKFTSNFNDWERDRHKNRVMGNIQLCNKVFRQIKVKRTFFENIKTLEQIILIEAVKFFCMFILNREKRHEIRDEFVYKIRNRLER